VVVAAFSLAIFWWAQRVRLDPGRVKEIVEHAMDGESEESTEEERSPGGALITTRCRPGSDD
jgi:hypothetical protein